MEDSALKECPFCGSAELLQTDQMVCETEGPLACDPNDPPDDDWFVVCGDCGAMGPMSPSAEKAQAAWNRRA
jgi:Lar family restriction alleviation protein